MAGPAGTYQWRAYTNYTAEDYTCDGQPLDHGVSPNDGTTWKTADIGGASETHTYSYYYRDASAYCWEGAECFCNESSSRVVFNVTETWTTSRNTTTNVLRIDVHTVLNSVVRDDVVGRQSTLYGRLIQVYDHAGTLKATFNEDGNQVTQAHTISGSIDLGTQTIFINPGNATTGVSTLQIHNSVPGSTSWDDIKAGAQFRNTLPVPTTYTLSYNANGGSGAPSAQTASTGAGNYTFTIPSTRPTHAWWDFLGWAGSSSATTSQYSPGASITLLESSPTKTLYAVWDKSYIPGQIWDGSAWMSHDRANRTAGIWNGSSWRTMRTKDGATGSGDPPEIQHSSGLKNMRKIGQY